ncbi:serine/threonine protein kinase [Aliiglaciecola sp. LCG003]|uniref:serine/threonine protein kinase n=1 Tax=Aliiglaciecola sp. LCG003 TaxID=3053655 RepID=UPI00257399F7|nr:serine/threonine protein kinase [Aliiglaciecola sp. LCG003]WJG08795.1 serine/threonine protein kinase [Aliiglaciecola sp. LCG003]
MSITDDAKFNFEQLGPDLILDAIESKGILVESGLLALNSYENRVYQFIAQDNKRYVTKFYRPQRWSTEQIQEEHDFSQELHDHEIPVVAPIRIEQQSLHQYQGYQFAIFPSVGGRQFEVDNLDQVEWMGRFIGRIHQVGQGKPFTYRPSFSIQEHLIDATETLHNTQLIPQSLHTAFFTILEQVVSLTSQLYKPEKMIRLHGDCHPGNILWRDGPTFVDLDDCRMGPAIQDLWMMLSGDQNQQRIQLDTLIEAYDEFYHFDTRQLGQIEPLRAMRMVHYMAWLSRRWQDPAFPQAFPWFAEAKYWEQQILALKEQYSALQEPSITLF